VYVASESENMIAVYTRNTTTGALTFLEAQEDGVGGVDGLRHTIGVAVTADGKCVYGTGETDDLVATFTRNVVTGALTFASVNAVNRAQDLVVSPDDVHVYVMGASTGSNQVVEVFKRTPPACALSSVEQETGDGDGLGKIAKGIAISPDGAHLYTGGTFYDGTSSQGAVNVFSRNAVTGALTFLERKVDEADGVINLANVVAGLAVSPDGKNVYAASRGEDALVVFDRDTGTGLLTFREFQQDGGIIDGLKGPYGVVVSPDGAYVYAVGHGEGSAVVFRRDATTGALKFLEDREDPYIDPPNEVQPAPAALALSPLGDSLYVGGKGAVVYDVDQCGDGHVGTDEQCDDGNVVAGDGCSSACRLELCGAAPAGGCRGTAPLKAAFKIKDRTPDKNDQLQFKWNSGDATLLTEYGDPTTTATYVLCVYDASANPQPLLQLAAPAGGICKNGKPCWKSNANNYKYNDGLLTPDGVQIVQLKEGLVNGKAQIQVKGRGINLLPATSPMPFTAPVTAQVRNTQTGVCWDAVITSPDDNFPDYFKGKGD
jgi:cysteine-rich repeat protein